MNYQQPQQQQMNPAASQQQQQQAGGMPPTRMMRPNIAHGTQSQMSPNVAATQPLQQQQMNVYQQQQQHHPVVGVGGPTGGGPGPGALSFSPQQHGMMAAAGHTHPPGGTAGVGPQSAQQQQPQMHAGPGVGGMYNQPAPQQPQMQMMPLGGSATLQMAQQQQQPQSVGPGSQQQQPSQQQQQMHTPISNAPATPATPQQQHLQQPHSIGPPSSTATTVAVGAPHSQQQPGSVQIQQPASIGAPGGPMSTPMSGYGGGGGGFVPTPSSGGSTASKQPQHPAHPLATVNSEFDPVGMAKMLILKDLRRSIVDLNMCADKIVEGLLSTGGTSSASSHAAPGAGGIGTSPATGEKHDEKKTTTIAAGIGASPHSIGPQSNLGFGPHSANPHSVQNPLSVQNPQSVNPQSVSALGPPGSVRSIDESTTTTAAGKREMSLSEQYEMAKNTFMNVCDNIERNMLLVLEVNKQQAKLFNPQTGLAVAWQPLAATSDLSSSTLQQALHGFTEQMNADKQAIRANIDDLNALMKLVSGDRSSAPTSAAAAAAAIKMEE